MRRKTPTNRSRLARASPTRSPRPKPTPLLYTREQTAAVLGNISVATVRRMEKRGLLHPVRINPHAGERALVFHRVDDVHALAQGGDDA